uniref:Uncharacterized protein n=1 Tax=Chromera velia CCMP2878 TaxID=1169474 RepID=A0A0G4H8B0_9ALVE|eukprot:Cvel_870.t1-p1 / transcript=Cvel_870.t1 / gene=Cvel_870 / organism=Chromera_velia_CCMP2878 / gene_product=hypothetical protein / transcript_product=hypothetical protein / location=Cvel_scaffold27:85916-93244(+) / protein_length=789 / sequence_SO=supercontig / SO=protein_coding / is_pseudo=false
MIPRACLNLFISVLALTSALSASLRVGQRERERAGSLIERQSLVDTGGDRHRDNDREPHSALASRTASFFPNSAATAGRNAVAKMMSLNVDGFRKQCLIKASECFDRIAKKGLKTEIPPKEDEGPQQKVSALHLFDECEGLIESEFSQENPNEMLDTSQACERMNKKQRQEGQKGVAALIESLQPDVVLLQGSGRHGLGRFLPSGYISAVAADSAVLIRTSVVSVVSSFATVLSGADEESSGASNHVPACADLNFSPEGVQHPLMACSVEVSDSDASALVKAVRAYRRTGAAADMSIPAIIGGVFSSSSSFPEPSSGGERAAPSAMTTFEQQCYALASSPPEVEDDGGESGKGSIYVGQPMLSTDSMGGLKEVPNDSSKFPALVVEVSLIPAFLADQKADTSISLLKNAGKMETAVHSGAVRLCYEESCGPCEITPGMVLNWVDSVDIFSLKEWREEMITNISSALTLKEQRYMAQYFQDVTRELQTGPAKQVSFKQLENTIRGLEYASSSKTAWKHLRSRIDTMSAGARELSEKLEWLIGQMDSFGWRVKNDLMIPYTFSAIMMHRKGEMQPVSLVNLRMVHVIGDLEGIPSYGPAPREKSKQRAQVFKEFLLSHPEISHQDCWHFGPEQISKDPSLAPLSSGGPMMGLPLPPVEGKDDDIFWTGDPATELSQEKGHERFLLLEGNGRAAGLKLGFMMALQEDPNIKPPMVDILAFPPEAGEDPRVTRNIWALGQLTRAVKTSNLKLDGYVSTCGTLKANEEQAQKVRENPIMFAMEPEEFVREWKTC